ncbi:heme-binding protein [Limnoglobus roseus]|uniref:FG-GAP repeat protein n=1 Tax=Limnoglobus roseus TaxID=2598579 RepID=A0A5C1ANB0_9BACT|nr:heme-binding protein [Limnoglobus roseus]QEL19476.1 FG-GAP repeat protein [Limnoglobus roseus]
MALSRFRRRLSQLRFERLDDRALPSAAAAIYAVGADAGAAPLVQVYDAGGILLRSFAPYESSFTGGVRVAVGDVNGDGRPEVVTAAGTGGGPLVKVFDPDSGQELGSFFAYTPDFRGGVNVAVGQLGGRAAIVTGTGVGGGPHVKAFFDLSGNPAMSFFAYDSSFRNGVNVAVGDVLGTGSGEIVTGAGVGGGPHVRVFDGVTTAEQRSFFAYDAGFRGGVAVAVGDTDGDGKPDIVTGAGPGGGPNVKTFDATTLRVSQSFFAYTPTFTAGVTVAAVAGPAGRDLIVTGAGPGSGPEVRTFDVTDTATQSSSAFDFPFLGGVALGTGFGTTATADFSRQVNQLPTGPTPLDGNEVLAAADVGTLLQRAAAATSSTDGIIAIVDRNGRILGVRVEGGVAPQVQNDPRTLTFAVDGAVALARTGALFGNNESPLTSRTIRNLSQSTITQREAESSPDLVDQNSLFYGPGFVAPVGVGGHFPPGVPFTPSADLFDIEHTNRDGTLHSDGTGGSIALTQRFNLPEEYVPAGQSLFPQDSYGYRSGLLSTAQGRGIGTLNGGIPIYKNGVLVGGIGVFYPGTTGYATEENPSESTTYDASKPDRTQEAEYAAVAAVGGAPGIGLAVGTLGGVALPPGIVGLPITPDKQRIDLNGVTLDIVGPGGTEGPGRLVSYGQTLGTGDPDTGRDLPVTPTAGLSEADGSTLAANQTLLEGKLAPSGWLVLPHDGDGISAAQVLAFVNQGVAQATKTRAAIRLPASNSTKFVFAVADRQGNVLGLYRMGDATTFSIDVAVAKARNVAYYADATQLQSVDQLPGIPAGTAFSNRTFRHLAQPRFPEGIDGNAPAVFSQLNDDPGIDRTTGLQVGPRQPASAFTSVAGHDAFFPQTNFRDATDPLNQNGVVFFPGAVPLYTTALVGGLGVSGDGVDQDDLDTFAASQGFRQPAGVQEVDELLFDGVRLPYQKFPRNPEL